MNRFALVRELVKDPSLRVTEIAWKTGYNKGHVSRLRKEAIKQRADYERGVVDGMQRQMQSSVDKAINKTKIFGPGFDLAKVGEVGVWGQCEPQQALEDGWCDWVCPRPQVYLMQCCDCELIHEVDFRVVRYESKSSEVYEVVDDPNLQAQMRMKRRDDLSPKREWLSLTDQEVWEAIEDVLEGGGWLDVARTLEQAIKEKNS